jgi:hypothetical protein
MHNPRMASWPVFVQDWQIDCCGERFALGGTVSWTLAFRPHDDQFGWPDPMVIELEPAFRWAVPDGPGSGQCVTVAPGIEAAILGPALHGHERLRGTLVEEHHGSVPQSLAAVTGTVDRIQIVSQGFRRVHDITWVPIAGAVQLRDVERVPDDFCREAQLGDCTTHEIGVLVDIRPMITSGSAATAEHRGSG